MNLVKAGLVDCLMESNPQTRILNPVLSAARVVFRIPDWLHHLLAAGRILLKNTLEAYMDQYMQSKLDQVLQEHRMVSLITQLRGSFLLLADVPSASHVA